MCLSNGIIRWLVGANGTVGVQELREVSFVVVLVVSQPLGPVLVNVLVNSSVYPSKLTSHKAAVYLSLQIHIF